MTVRWSFSLRSIRFPPTQDNRVTKQKGSFNKTVAAKAKYIQPVHDFLMRKGYFLQSLCQIPIDAITWVGAYNQALQKGRTTEEAVLDADSVIRTTMSDFSPKTLRMLKQEMLCTAPSLFSTTTSTCSSIFSMSASTQTAWRRN